jgi:hypothetical protein
MEYSHKFIGYIVKRLWDHNAIDPWDDNIEESLENPSVVLVPIGTNIPASSAPPPQPCIILNKRSYKVRQPGDLCCPGGGISPLLDSLAAKLLLLPKSPLAYWPGWKYTRKLNPERASKLALYLAAALREGFEEMRLNPLKVKFLGMLPAQKLIMFKKTIIPMVIWVPDQQHFKPNWEVESIVYLTLKKLLEPHRYARYRLEYTDMPPKRMIPARDEFPCFVHRHNKEFELLWGATYRIIISFLKIIFNFQPPDHNKLKQYTGQIGQNYMRGRDGLNT